MDRPFPSLTDFPEDRARFESVPSLQQTHDRPYDLDVIAEPSQDDTWIETRQIDTVPPEPYEVDELFEEDEVVTYVEAYPGEDEELSVHHRESSINRFLRLRRERKQAMSDFDDSSFEEPAQLAAQAPVVANERYEESMQRADPWLDARRTSLNCQRVPDSTCSRMCPNLDERS